MKNPDSGCWIQWPLTPGLFVVAIFLIRDESYLDTLPQEHRPVFQDENPVAPAKIKVLKQMIEDRFPVSQVHPKTGSR